MKTFKYITFILFVCFLAACTKEDEIIPVVETVLLTQNVEGTVLIDTDKDGTGDIPYVGARVYLGDFTLINEIIGQLPDTLSAPYNDILWADVDADGNYAMNSVLEMTDKSLVVYSPQKVTGILGTDTTPDGDFLETEIFGIISITVEENETDDGNDFIIQLVNYGQISGNVQIDNDKDDIIDGPLEGAKLWLSRRDMVSGGPIGLALDFTFTDANGNYNFDQVEKGDYIVLFGSVTEYRVTSGIDESPDSDPTHPIEDFLPVSLEEGEVDTDNNFKTVPIWYNVSGSVLEDTNADGSGDAGIYGLTVELYTRDSSGLPVGERVSWRKTDPDGAFRFRDLTVGEYVVKITDFDLYDCVSNADLSPEVNEPTNHSSCDLIQTNVTTPISIDADNTFILKLK